MSTGTVAVHSILLPLYSKIKLLVCFIIFNEYHLTLNIILNDSQPARLFIDDFGRNLPL
jgi:hypothetical protein